MFVWLCSCFGCDLLCDDVWCVVVCAWLLCLCAVCLNVFVSFVCDALRGVVWCWCDLCVRFVIVCAA